MRIRVRGNEIDAFDFRGDHVGDGVSARAANADYGYAGAQLVNRGRADIDAHLSLQRALRDVAPLPCLCHKEILTCKVYPSLSTVSLQGGKPCPNAQKYSLIALNSRRTNAKPWSRVVSV